MTITRIDPAERWSEAVIHNNLIYYTSVPTDLSNDAYVQTKSALAEIDQILARANSDKSRILDTTIFLVNKSDFSAMNKAWDEWVAKGKAPVRCTVNAGLMKEEYLIEIKIVAAVNP
jgi:enamine deaminase RidA (YjgF/YER057c/UK114 family)